MIKIGNAQAFWGDSPLAPMLLISQQPDLDYLTLDYLAEVSLSIMAIQREKDPVMGYARDFIDVVRSLIPFWKKGCKTKIICNAGGLNPYGCAQACLEALKKEGLDLKIGIVTGDSVLDKLTDNKNLDTNEPLAAIKDRLVSANAYLGGAPIAEALRKGADIVITGRVADPSLTVGACMKEFDWKADDYDRIAGATVAGHLIECGTQVTGGISTNWLKLPQLDKIGFPFVEIDREGIFTITKPRNTGGRVDQWTVKEQLLYEIGDPSRYLSPDATVSFAHLKVTELGPDRVRVSGAAGSEPPSQYKVSATYRDGFKVDAMIGVFGVNAALKAQKCGEIVLQKVNNAGFKLERSLIETLGCGSIVPGVFPEQGKNSLECILRISAADSNKEALEYFSKEIAALVTSGPQGVCGYTSGRPHIRPIFGYWPCLISRELVKPKVEII